MSLIGILAAAYFSCVLVFPFLSAFGIEGARIKAVGAALKLGLIITTAYSVHKSGPISWSGLSVLDGYPIDAAFSIDMHRLILVLVYELCFSIVQQLEFAKSVAGGRARNVLFDIGHAVNLGLVFADNVILIGMACLVLAIVFYFALGLEKSNEEGEAQSTAALGMFYGVTIYAFLFFCWTVADFSASGMNIKNHGSGAQLALGLLVLVLSVPNALWTGWYRSVLSGYSGQAAVMLTAFLSSRLFKALGAFEADFPDRSDVQRLVIVGFGCLSFCGSMIRILAPRIKSDIFFEYPYILFSMIICLFGFAGGDAGPRVLFICYFLPALTTLLLLMNTKDKSASFLQTVFNFSAAAVLIGFPGSPIYFILSGIGSSASPLGVGYSAIAMVLWLLYLVAASRAALEIVFPARPVEAPAVDRGLSFVVGGLALLFLSMVLTALGGLI